MYSELLRRIADIRAENTVKLAKYEKIIRQNEFEKRYDQSAVSGPNTKRIIPIVKNSGNTTRFTS